jgi:hypothetical protein
MKRVEHAKQVWFIRNAYRILVEKLEGKYHFRGLGRGGTIKLNES